MPTDYVMNRLVVGSTVKTTEAYESQCLSMFGKVKPIKKGNILEIETESKIATIKLPSGKLRTINLFWLQLT